MNFAPRRTWFGDARMHSVLFDVLKRSPPAHVHIDMQSVMSTEETRLMELYKRGLLSHAELTQIELEAKGGACPKCSRQWVKRQVDNIFCHFTYYETGCTCYLACYNCGCYLMREAIEDIPYCTNCRRVERCHEIVDVEVTTPSGRKLKRRQRCPGMMLLSGKGYSCDNCGHRITGYLLEEGVIVPLVFIGGANRQSGYSARA